METAIPLICPEIIGRDEELKALNQALQNKDLSQSQLIFLTGEAGIGKSRLTGEIKRKALQIGFAIFQCNCFEQDQNFPFGPWIEGIMAFLSANVYHHQVALMEMAHYQQVPKGYAGLYHAAFLYPGPYELAVVVKHIVDQGYPIDLCHDYGIGKFVNLRDPDGIPLELYYDYPPEQWPRVDGQLRMPHRNVTIEELLQPLEQTTERI